MRVSETLLSLSLSLCHCEEAAASELQPSKGKRRKVTVELSAAETLQMGGRTPATVNVRVLKNGKLEVMDGHGKNGKEKLSEHEPVVFHLVKEEPTQKDEYEEQCKQFKHTFHSSPARVNPGRAALLVGANLIVLSA